MQEINLLQNKLQDKTNQWESNNQLYVIVLSIILILELAGGGFLYLSTKSVNEEKLVLDTANVKIQKDLDDMEDRLADAKSFQAQSKNLKNILASHVAWTPLMNELTLSAFKGAHYLNMIGTTTGIVTVEGIAKNYTDLGKSLLALETSGQFEEINLNSTSVSEDELAGVTFSVDIALKSDLFSADKANK